VAQVQPAPVENPLAFELEDLRGDHRLAVHPEDAATTIVDHHGIEGADFVAQSVL
jgi:hypothetical protein